MKDIKVILVDDHNLFRNGLKLLLSGYPNIHVVAEASEGEEFITVLENTPADVVLLDIEMPGMNGIEATRAAIAKYPDLKIISLSMYGEEEYYYKMIDAGVKGFILKSSDISEVIKAIQAVLTGGTYFTPDVLYNVVKNIKTVVGNPNNTASLSERELEVLEQICRGLSNQEIADALFISKRTVEKHRASLLSKTNTKNTAHLVMYAIENKLVDI
jgi:DNA-binding NarL/FixJ family response regulator